MRAIELIGQPEMDVLVALQKWFESQCDGDWEHQHGIKIETCDNPGWWVKIDLTDTPLHSRPFTAIAENVGADGFPDGPRWLHCQVKEGVWQGAGDETKLTLILQAFLTWAAAIDTT